MDANYEVNPKNSGKKRGCLIAVLAVIGLSLISAMLRSCFSGKKPVPPEPTNSITEESDTETSASQMTQSTTKQTTTSTTKQTTTSRADTTMTSSSETTKKEALLSPDFKAMMDSYEAFFDSYIDFMQRYKQAQDQLSMMTEYMDFMQKYADYMQKISAMDESEMNEAELAYYIAVTARIEQKLLKASL